jgi:cGMP-dependent protein kinase
MSSLTVEWWQGDEGDLFYIVASGKIKVTESFGAMERFLMVDDCIGETALVHSNTHDFTAIAEEDTLLWALGRDDFRKAIRRNVSKQQSAPVEALRNLPMFECFTEQERSELVDVMDKLTVPADKELEIENQQGEKLYIVRKGKCVVTQAARRMPKRLSCRNLESASSKSKGVKASCHGNYFGVSALMRRTPATPSSVTATTAGKVSCFCLTREAFISVTNEDLDTVMRRGIVGRLGHVEMLSKLERADLEFIADCLHPHFFTPGEVVYRQGDLSLADPDVNSSSPIPAFYIIERGECRVTHNHPDYGPIEVRRLHKRGSFGLNAVYPSPKEQQCTVDASCDLFCWGMALSDLNTCMARSEAFVHCIKNELGEFQTRLNRRIQEAAQDAEQHIALASLSPLAILGVGSFGQVKLVREKGTGKTYALKCMQKKLIVNYGQKAHVMNEKAILSEIRHPFVNRLLRTYKDRHYLYMLLEVVLGGELFSLLKRKIRLADGDAQFYAANIALFFEIMHTHHTVYRDLKPEVWPVLYPTPTC